NGEIPAPSTLVGDVPASLDAVVLRGLERDAGRRFRSALEMSKALEQAIIVSNGSAVEEWAEKAAGTPLQVRAARITQIEGHATEGVQHLAPANLTIAASASEDPTELSASLALDPAQEATVQEVPPRTRRWHRRRLLGAPWWVPLLIVVGALSVTLLVRGS